MPQQNGCLTTPGRRRVDNPTNAIDLRRQPLPGEDRTLELPFLKFRSHRSEIYNFTCNILRPATYPRRESLGTTFHQACARTELLFRCHRFVIAECGTARRIADSRFLKCGILAEFYDRRITIDLHAAWRRPRRHCGCHF